MGGDGEVQLPQTKGSTFLSDGGIETYLIFQRGIELPEFAAFVLLEDERGRDELREYYRPFLAAAAEDGLGFILESPTWRANPRWGEAIGYDRTAVREANLAAIGLMVGLREEAGGRPAPIVISGCVGPHDDGYSPDVRLDAEAAQDYHSDQVGAFAGSAADQVTAVTMTYADEALGVARAARAAGIPAVISFTVETDGRLPSGQELPDAIAEVDGDADTDVAYFMVNCAHPTHFAHVIDSGEPWLERVRGVRANASTMSHAELDEATELDDGDPADFGSRHRELRERMPALNVFGGCCGTDVRHVVAIRDAIAG